MVSFIRNIIICFILVQGTFAQNVPWTTPVITASNSKLIIDCEPKINNLALSFGDYIGVFDSLDNCYGLGKWKDTINFTINVSETTNDGSDKSARMKFKIWLHKEDCIVDNLSEISADTSLVFKTSLTNRINVLNFVKASVAYPKPEYCLNEPRIGPLVNYAPPKLQFSSVTGLSIDSGSGVIDPGKCSPGTFTIFVDAQKHCVANKALTITMHDYPRIKQVPDTFICGERLSIAGPTGYGSLEWSTGQTANNIDITTPASISYKVTNAYGCSNSDTFNVKKTELKRLDYFTITADCEKKGRLNITNSEITSGHPPYKYKLTNLLDNSVVTDIENVPEGLYRITVINANGCELTYNAKILMEKDCLNDKPVFSPNADGMDDRYFINLEGNIKIFDRNGTLKRTVVGPVYFDGNDEKGHPLAMGTCLVVSDKGRTITLTIVK